MEQPSMFDFPEEEAAPTHEGLVPKLYLKQNDTIRLLKSVVDSLYIWVDPNEPEDAERDAERERATAEKTRAIMAEHKHETWCHGLQAWLKTSPSVGLAGAAYNKVYGVHIPIDHKMWAEKAVEEYDLENWVEALLYWRGNAYNPLNIHGIIGRAKHYFTIYNRGQLPVLAAVDPIFLEKEQE